MWLASVGFTLKAKSPLGWSGRAFAKGCDPDLSVRFGLRKLGHALDVLEGTALLEELNALKTFQHVALGTG